MSLYVKISDFSMQDSQLIKILWRILTPKCVAGNSSRTPHWTKQYHTTCKVIHLEYIHSHWFLHQLGYCPTRVLDVPVALSPSSERYNATHILTHSIRHYHQEKQMYWEHFSRQTNVLGAVQKHQEPITKFYSLT